LPISNIHGLLESPRCLTIHNHQAIQVPHIRLLNEGVIRNFGKLDVLNRKKLQGKETQKEQPPPYQQINNKGIISLFHQISLF
jgi:hypothetical protein